MLKITINADIINRFIAIKKLLKQPNSYNLNYSVFIDDRDKMRRYWCTNGHILCMYEEENKTDFTLPKYETIVLDIEKLSKLKEYFLTLVFEDENNLINEVNGRCKSNIPPMVDNILKGIETWEETKTYQTVDPVYLKALEDFSKEKVWSSIPLTKDVTNNTCPLLWKTKDTDYKITMLVMPVKSLHKNTDAE